MVVYCGMTKKNQINFEQRFCQPVQTWCINSGINLEHNLININTFTWNTKSCKHFNTFIKNYTKLLNVY